MSTRPGHAAGRRPEHRRNDALEATLARLNDLLATRPPHGLPDGGAPTPCVLVVGPPRSGTTLLLQVLARTGRVTWPSNLVARFWRRPAVGLLVQEMLVDPAQQFGEDLVDLHEALLPVQRTSRLGKTSGALAPNEFWYWWRAHLGDGIGDVGRPAPSRAQWERLAASLGEMHEVARRPVAMKAQIAWQHLDVLAELLPAALLVRVHRDRAALVDSVLRARVEHAGAEGAWWSFRTHEQAHGSPREQVERQVEVLEAAVDAFGQRHPDHLAEVDLDELISDERATASRVLERLSATGR